MTDLGTLPGSTACTAIGNNGSGQIVGYCSVGGPPHVVL
jgi:hypothetical protein